MRRPRPRAHAARQVGALCAKTMASSSLLSWLYYPLSRCSCGMPSHAVFPAVINPSTPYSWSRLLHRRRQHQAHPSRKRGSAPTH